MRKIEIIKTFIIILGIFIIFPSFISWAVEAKEEPLEIEKFGSIAQLYKALSPELSFEEYLAREAEARGLIIKKKAGEDAHKSYQGLHYALQILSYIRERFREIERRRAEIFSRPVRSATPGKTVNEDGSVSYSGTNTKIAKYILRKYAQKYPEVTGEDLSEVEKRIDETAGNQAHKGFSITFNIKNKDKLDNETRIPIQVALRDENTHFLSWSFSKALTPKFAQDENNPQDMFIYYEPTYNYVKYLECKGDWWGFNSKDTNAFGWAVKTLQELRELRTGVVTNIESDVKEMDFSLREARLTHRRVTEVGEYSHSYEEDLKILDYYSTFDEEGNTNYLPQVVEIIHYNDNQAPGLVTTRYRYYHYDEYDRVDKSLEVVHLKSEDESMNYFSVSLQKVYTFDPLTGLSPVDEEPWTIPFCLGTAEEAKKYGELIWQASFDEELKQQLGEVVTDSSEIMKLYWEIADLVIREGLNYETAKINVIAKYNSQMEEKNMASLAKNLILEEDSTEIKKLEKQLQELLELYGGKINLPNL